MSSLSFGKILAPLIGGILGFVYYRLIGCPSGACPITANPYTSTAYGAILGFLLSGVR